MVYSRKEVPTLVRHESPYETCRNWESTVNTSYVDASYIYNGAFVYVLGGLKTSDFV